MANSARHSGSCIKILPDSHAKLTRAFLRDLKQELHLFLMVPSQQATGSRQQAARRWQREQATQSSRRSRWPGSGISSRASPPLQFRAPGARMRTSNWQPGSRQQAAHSRQQAAGRGNRQQTAGSGQQTMVVVVVFVVVVVVLVVVVVAVVVVIVVAVVIVCVVPFATTSPQNASVDTANSLRRKRSDGLRA
jgi:hypothetical protein